MHEIYYSGEIFLTEQGKEKYRQICEHLDKYCYHEEDWPDRITIFNTNTDYYQMKEVLSDISKHGYIDNACVKATGNNNRHWCLIYLPDQDVWQEFRGKLLYKNDVLDAICFLTPEQQKAVLQKLWYNKTIEKEKNND